MKSNTLSWLKLNEKNKIIDIIKKHKVILAPSDTVFGLAGIACVQVFNELNRLKGRSEKPYLVLAQSIETVYKIAVMPQTVNIKLVLETFWPGPLTIIFKAQKNTSDYLVAKNGTIAVRIPQNDFLQELLSLYPLLFSTSANKAGQPIVDTLEFIDDGLKKEVAAIVFTDELKKKQSIVSSTIIDLSDGSLRLVREGAIPFSEINKIVD